MRFSSAFVVCFYFLLLFFCCSSSVSAACKITTRTTAAGDRQQYRNSNFENERAALALVLSLSQPYALTLCPSCALSLCFALATCSCALATCCAVQLPEFEQQIRSETNEISKQNWKYIVRIYFAPSTRLFFLFVYASLSPSTTLPLLFCLSTFPPRLFIFNAISSAATHGAC